jgi:hypothetical protein
MDEFKHEAWVGNWTPKSINRPPSFDPMRFVAPLAIRTRKVLISELAYFRALNRGFEPGHEVEDWLEAEAEFEKRHGTRHQR